jgi:uncharacterized membrane protein
VLIWLHHIHCFAKSQGLYPVVLATFLAAVLFAGRVYLSERFTYLFLVWNLFLAWIPYALSFCIALISQRYPHSRCHLLLLGPVWLVFFPNAPYIITDYLHLQPRSPVPIWYDIGLLTTFAWTGLFLAIFSLRSMQMLIKSMAGSLAGWFFVICSVGLSGLGVYMGRFLRWNSWDLLFQPHAILGDVAVRFANPLDYPGTFGVTFLFAIFLLVCYLTITASSLQEQSS